MPFNAIDFVICLSLPLACGDSDSPNIEKYWIIKLKEINHWFCINFVNPIIIRSDRTLSWYHVWKFSHIKEFIISALIFKALCVTAVKFYHFSYHRFPGVRQKNMVMRHAQRLFNLSEFIGAAYRQNQTSIKLSYFDSLYYLSKCLPRRITL